MRVRSDQEEVQVMLRGDNGCSLRRLAAGAVAITLGNACGGSEDYNYLPGDYDYYDYPYGDAYTYGYYYPADLGYSDAYYSDPMYANSVYKSTEEMLGEARTMRESIRAIALGRDVCAERVSVSVESASVPCSPSEGVSEMPIRTRLVFEDCTVESGGVLDGSMEIQSQHSFSDVDCDPDSVLDVAFTSRTVDLTYTAPSGARLVLPSMTRGGSYSRPLRGRPTEIAVRTEGMVEAYRPDGALLVSMTVSGAQRIIAGEGADDYVINGTVRIEDLGPDESLVIVTGSNVVRTPKCCHPTSGVIDVAAFTSGENDHFSFGPGCGDVKVNGETVPSGVCF